MNQRVESGADLDSLARTAGTGDQKAVTTLLATIQPRIIPYCRARIDARNSADASAEDVAQEALIAIVRALPSYRDDHAGFSAFAFGIAAHKVADFYRKRQREPVTSVAEFPSIPDTGAGPERSVLDAEQRRKIRQLLATLSENQREILIHRLVSGLSSEETAQVLATTPGAVRVAQHRALERLRRTVGGKLRCST